MQKRVCVIGAGVSGLVALKELREEGHRVECFEVGDDLGGAFASPEQSSSARAYQSLHLTISNYYMAFSDFPPRDGWRFWTGPEYLQYLRDYAAHFALEPAIVFGRRVVRVARGTPGWEVFTQPTRGGPVSRHVFDAVAVCCGTHQIPKSPNISGIDSFSGQIRHSYNFWNAADYAGKRVVLVGLGESSADIVRDISDVSSSCHLIMRQYPFVLPRVLPEGFPADSMTSRVLYPSRDDSFWTWLLFFIFVGLFWLPMTLLNWIPHWKGEKDAFGQNIRAYMDVKTVRTQETIALLAKWHSESNVSFANKFATKNGSWIPNVLSGKISPHLGKISRISGEQVFLDDGSVVEADFLVFCTGYKDEFAFLPADVAPPNNDVRQLFLHAFNPTVDSSLAFIGFSRPTTGAIPICSELVARYFALLVSGKRQLPSNIKQLAVADAKWEDSQLYNSLEVRSCVNPCEYMDTVARLIGCYRSPWHYALRPLAYLNWMAALNCAARFRLVGPHAKPEIAKAWMDQIPVVLPLPALVGLSLYKILYSLRLVSGDIMLDLRKWNVEATWVLALG